VESVRDRTPLLIVVGDTERTDKGNLQNIEQRLFVEPTGAGFEQLRSPSTVIEDVVCAMGRALSELRPIVLNVPIEFTWSETPPSTSKVLPQNFPGAAEVKPDTTTLEEAAAVLATADRPVVLAGRGAISSSAKRALVELAGAIGAPVGTTLRARELFVGNEHNLGIVGSLSHQVAAEVVGDADVLVAFGAALNSYTT